MLPHLAMEAVGELTTILSSKPAGFPSASNLPEIDLFGRRTRLLLIGEPSGTIYPSAGLAARARRILILLERNGVTPVLLTQDTASPLAIALRNAGWGIMSEPVGAIADAAGRPPPLSAAMDGPRHSAIGAGRRLNVLCALWQLRKDEFTAARLAVMAEVSAPIGRRVLSDGVAAGWIIRSKHGREHEFTIANVRTLVGISRVLSEAEPRRWQGFLVRPDIFASLPQHLAEFCQLYDLQYAVTGHYAATYYLARANAASELRLRIGPSPRLADFLAHLRAVPADAAANLKIMISVEPACWLFMARTDGLKLANPLVVAGDLAQDRDILASSLDDWLCG